MAAAEYVHVIPADGWWAVYKEDDGSRYRSKIVAIAVHADGGVSWLDPDGSGWVEDAMGTKNLEGIYYEGDPKLENTVR